MGPTVASSLVALAIGVAVASFAQALNRRERLWPSGLALAILIPLFIAIKVAS